MRGWIVGFWVLVLGPVGSGAWAGPGDEIPAAFSPFESWIGGWKGTAKPASNPLKGWQESHSWAWKFEKGKPVGLSVTFEGNKTLAKAAIAYDEPSKKYKLDGTDPAGKPVAFLGSLGDDGKSLTLDRVDKTGESKERLTLRATSNKIRYTLQLDRQEPGAPQYKGIITVGLTKDGESFAAGSGAADLPKCIMTGGAAGMTVSYMGKSYPICCTGCRDEFNDNPSKYAKIADLAAKDRPAAKDDKPATKGKDDGSFDGLIGESSTKKDPKSVITSKAKKDKDPNPPAETKPAKAKDDPATKATRELQLGQNLEKAGKKAQALDHFRTVVKDYPDTESAKTAAARIKALEGK